MRAFIGSVQDSIFLSLYIVTGDCAYNGLGRATANFILKYSPLVTNDLRFTLKSCRSIGTHTAT
jgi:hypothetical protein